MADTPGGTVLVVSDDPDVSDEARFALPGDLTIELATDGTEAIDKLASLRVSVVIVDLRTGRAGGYALARDMSQQSKLAGIPIVILIEREQDRWIAGQAGAAVILRKPLEPGALARAVAEIAA